MTENELTEAQQLEEAIVNLAGSLTKTEATVEAMVNRHAAYCKRHPDDQLMLSWGEMLTMLHSAMSHAR